MLIRLMSGGVINVFNTAGFGYSYDKKCVFFLVNKQTFDVINMNSETHQYEPDLGHELVNEIWEAIRSGCRTFDTKLWMEQHATPKEDVKLAT